MVLRLFRVKQGTLELIEESIFSTGDAYLVVDEEGQKIYIWLGSKCSADEKGTAAVEARRIDDGQIFNGNAKIITFDEGEESAEFTTKLGGLKIIDANLSKSMLKDVTTGEFAGQAEHVNALYRISSEEYEGISAIKYTQVPFERSSLNTEDVFISDLGVDVWIWQGAEANIKEKVKAMQVAREFDASRAGNQRPKVFMQNVDDEEFMAIFEGYLPTQDRATVDLKLEHFDHAPTVAPLPRFEKPKEENPTPIKLPPEKPTTAKPIPVKPVVEKQPVEKPVAKTAASTTPAAEGSSLLVQKGSGRLACPKCNNSNKYNIREVEDRSILLMDYPILYGKKYICKQCGAEWRREE